MYKFRGTIYKEVNGVMLHCDAKAVGTSSELWESNLAPWWAERVRGLIASGKVKEVK